MSKSDILVGNIDATLKEIVLFLPSICLKISSGNHGMQLRTL